MSPLLCALCVGLCALRVKPWPTRSLLSERIQKRQIPLKKIKLPQTLAPRPNNLRENPILNLSTPTRNPKKYQQDSILPRISELITGNLNPRLRLNPQLLPKLAQQSLLRRFPRLYLPARKLPLQRVSLIRTPPANQDLAPALKNTRNHRSHRQDDSLHLWFAVSPELIDHFRNPRNVGELSAPAITVEVSNPVCGDILRFSIRMESGRVAEAGYKVRGCAASIATGSALTVLSAGRDREELALISRETVEAAVGGLSNESKHAAALCVDAVRAILRLC
jgi:nitrogen fixation NifU-like protein